MSEKIINENTSRTVGKDAQRNNILAAKLVANTIKTTLGPKGMDKMLVDALGDVIVTNDGVTILREMQIEHPTAKMIVEIAKTQEQEVGDGTTSAVIFAGEFLKNAEDLLDKKIHPTVLIRGYDLALKKANELLNSMGNKISIQDTERLNEIAATAMTGKGAEASKEFLSNVLVNAVKNISDSLDKNSIKIQSKIGGSVEDTQLVNGVILDKTKLSHAMPSRVEDAKILILSCPIEHKDMEMDAKIQITDPSQIQSFFDREELAIKQKVDKILSTGANCVFVQRGIDEYAQHIFTSNSTFAVRRITKADIEKLALATGASIVENIDNITTADLGHAKLIEQKFVGDEQMIFISGCDNPKASTILVRGGTAHVIKEIERALDDALGDIISALKCGAAVGGAGAVEIKLSRGLMEFANTFSGREQLAIQAYARAIEIIPTVLSENAGLDPIDTLASMKAKLSEGVAWPGINVETGVVVDSYSAGIIEPLKVKTQALKSSTEVAIMILRIDDMIAANRLSENN